MTDYKAAHLNFIKEQSQKGFIPKEYVDWKYNIPYLEMMRFTYSQPAATQEVAEMFYNADKKWLLDKQKISKSIDKRLQLLESTPDGRWFVTIGFNHQTWNIQKCTKCIEKILGMDWIIKAKANFELFRENGEHPHCHFLLETKEPKSRILDKLFRPKYVKDIVLARSFIDVKEAQPFHDKYINLDKQTLKQEYVEKDKEWRNKNNIPDYEKNWN